MIGIRLRGLVVSLVFCVLAEQRAVAGTTSTCPGAHLEAPQVTHVLSQGSDDRLILDGVFVEAEEVLPKVLRPQAAKSAPAVLVLAHGGGVKLTAVLDALNRASVNCELRIVPRRRGPEVFEEVAQEGAPVRVYLRRNGRVVVQDQDVSASQLAAAVKAALKGSDREVECYAEPGLELGELSWVALSSLRGELAPPECTEAPVEDRKSVV